MVRVSAKISGVWWCAVIIVSLSGCVAVDRFVQCESDDACGVGEACTNGACVALAADETCDQVDDDGDGVVDEDVVLEVPAEWLLGVCSAATVACDPEGGPALPEYRRIETYQASETRCDMLDNDCDGVVDEDSGCTYCPAGTEGPPCNGCAFDLSVPDGWVCIPAGTFILGQRGYEARDDHLGPIPGREVELTRPFLMMTTEVTQAQYLSGLMSGNPSLHTECPQCPVENGSLAQWMNYANALSEDAGLTSCYVNTNPDPDGTPWWSWTARWCDGYRLPTDAEWEYAARGGVENGLVWYEVEGLERSQVMWTRLNASVFGPCPEGDQGHNAETCFWPHEVGLLRPNPWGLYDMLGNVWEMVFDVVNRAPEPIDQDPVEGFGPETEFNNIGRIRRGGSYRTVLNQVSLTMRHQQCGLACTSIDTGFRLVRTLSPPAVSEETP